MSTPPVKTSFDNSLSYFYKQAIYLGVPIRYVLVRPNSVTEDKVFVERFDIDEHPNAKFLTIFNYIRDLTLKDPTKTLSDIAQGLKEVQGEQWNPLEIVSIWLHSIPEYQVDNPAVFQQIRDYLTQANEPIQFQNMNETVSYYQTFWIPYFRQELKKDTDIVSSYVQTQNQLEKIQPVNYSNIELSSVTVSYDLSYSINPLPDLFNNAVTSYLVPFIQYNIIPAKGLTDEGSRYYKIYKGKTLETHPLYGNIIIQPGVATKEQTIYLHIWSGVEQAAQTGKKEGFLLTTISYLSETSSLRVEVNCPYDEIKPNDMVDRLHAAIPDLPKPKPSEIRENKITGSLYMYGFDIIENLFAEFVLLEPIFRNYLYIEESQKIFSEKQTLVINYKGAIAEGSENGGTRSNKSAVTASIRQEVVNRGTAIKFMSNGQVVTSNADKDILSVRLNITKADSRKVADQFVNVVSRLFMIYLQNGPARFTELIRMVPQFQKVVDAKSREIQKEQQLPQTVVNGVIVENGAIEDSRIRLLRRAAPDIFIEGYARKCQKPNHPIPIRPEEAPIWREKTFQDKFGFVEQRQVVSFPPGNPKLTFVCPDDKYPYYGVVANSTLSNHHQYPLLPCCFKVNQADNPNSKFYRYYSGESPEDILRVDDETPATKTHRINTDKLLAYGRTGTIPTLISNFVKKYDLGSGTFIRYGVLRDTNSFIHCVALGMMDPKYIQSADKKQYVEDIRKSIVKAIRPESLRQELFDMTNDEIQAMINNNEVFFDPLLFYRALEIIYNCTIYVFALRDKDPDSDSDISLLQLPRHNGFHVHPPSSGKPVILIIRHKGAGSNKLTYPQCELIVDERPTGGMIAQFPEAMNKLLYPALSFVSRTLTWQINPNDRVLTARQNIYSSLNYEVIFGDIPVLGQVLDPSGKVRMFCIAPVLGTDGAILLFVNVPPTAPLNVPEVQLEQIRDRLPVYTRTTEAFGSPTKISTTISNGRVMMSGLWFPIGDLPEGLECPCQEVVYDKFIQDHPEYSQLPSGPNNAMVLNVPRQNPGVSPLDKIRIFKRAARFVTQIIVYLYLAAGRPTDIVRFLDSVIIRLNEQQSASLDTVQIYNTRGLARILPKGNPTQILEALHKQLPYLFFNQKILVLDQQMYDGLLFSLSRFNKTYANINVTMSRFQELTDYYSSKRDIHVDSREFILENISEYNTWSSTYVPSADIQQRDVQNLKANIQNRLLPNAFSYQEPYIYQQAGSTTIGTSLNPKEDKFYLVQNVAGGDFYRAINVAYGWYTGKINSGFATPPIKPPEEGGTIYAYVVYRISQGGNIVVDPNADKRSGHSVYLEMLNYGNNAFAAMLPIL